MSSLVSDPYQVLFLYLTFHFSDTSLPVHVRSSSFLLTASSFRKWYSRYATPFSKSVTTSSANYLCPPHQAEVAYDANEVLPPASERGQPRCPNISPAPNFSAAASTRLSAPIP